MATLNWRGAIVFLTYKALEIALHYFFGFLALRVHREN
jgi:hypothetical protein